MSLPALTGQSSTPGVCLLDRPVKPGDEDEAALDPSEDAPAVIWLKYLIELHFSNVCWATSSEQMTVTEPNTLQGRRILLIIGGGIAAYKSLDLIRRLRERGGAVPVVMTH